MENPEAVSKINSFKFFLDKEILKLVKGVA